MRIANRKLTQTEAFRSTLLCAMTLIISSQTTILSEASFQSEDYNAAVLQTEAREALQYYLDLDCGVASPRKNWPPSVLEHLRRISADAPEIETTLIRLLRSGPQEKYLAAITPTIEGQWLDLKSFMDQNTEIGFQPDDMRMLKNFMNTKEAYVQRERTRISKQYQERSAMALVEFAKHGSATAKEALKEIMNAGSAASKDAVRKAQKRLTSSPDSRRRQ